MLHDIPSVTLSRSLCNLRFRALQMLFVVVSALAGTSCGGCARQLCGYLARWQSRAIRQTIPVRQVLGQVDQVRSHDLLEVRQPRRSSTSAVGEASTVGQVQHREHSVASSHSVAACSSLPSASSLTMPVRASAPQEPPACQESIVHLPSRRRRPLGGSVAAG